MEITKTNIEGLLIIKPKIFGDERGYFFESFRLDILRELGIMQDFVQDNESMSGKGIVRGLHFQNPPFAQGKLVRVIKGKVLDVAVDIRKKSPTYGQWHSIILSEENKFIFWIPPGFAHGFHSMEENTLFQYKCTNYYNKEAEGSILWNDPDLNVDWEIKNPLISDKDKNVPLFKDLQSKF
jgi:dTDP-4-dehydrorhamnose 3,5-epimerase